MKGTHFFLTVLFYSLILPNLNAEDEGCHLSEDALVGIFDLSSKNISSHKPLGIDNRHFQEIVTLKSGLVIEYDVGGCAHYAYSYTFKNSGFKPSGDQTKDFEYVVNLIRQIPVTKENSDYIQILIGIVEKGKKSDWSKQAKGSNDYNLDCGGDAYCELNYDEPNEIYLSYDFPL